MGNTIFPMLFNILLIFFEIAYFQATHYLVFMDKESLNIGRSIYLLCLMRCKEWMGFFSF